VKSTLDKTIRGELINRINSLTEKSKPIWGKMNVYQMLKHCALAEELYLGKVSYKRSFIGRFIGKKALENMIKDETPFPKGMKTSPDFTVTDHGDYTEQKEKLIALINEYETFSKTSVVHWFFGKMTREQIGLFSYKHLDHHLRQFNV
jgi:hypothetical protein